MEGYAQLTGALNRLLTMSYDGGQGDAPFSEVQGHFGEIVEAFQARQIADLVNKVADAAEGEGEMPGSDVT